jgi:hypothetical protein
MGYAHDVGNNASDNHHNINVRRRDVLLPQNFLDEFRIHLTRRGVGGVKSSEAVQKAS